MRFPTLRGSMAKVDSKGRIVLPQDVREQLGVAPGSEVEVHEKDGKAIVEPEDDPDRIIQQMDQLVDGIAEREPTPYEDLNPQARDQVDTIRRKAEQARAEDNSE